jgi:hypothetical protein
LRWWALALLCLLLPRVDWWPRRKHPRVRWCLELRLLLVHQPHYSLIFGLVWSWFLGRNPRSCRLCAGTFVTRDLYLWSFSQCGRRWSGSRFWWLLALLRVHGALIELVWLLRILRCCLCINSSLATYLSLMPDDEVNIAAILAPADPHAPSVCTIHIGSVTSAVLWVSGVQSAKKSARA